MAARTINRKTKTQAVSRRQPLRFRFHRPCTVCNNNNNIDNKKITCKYYTGIRTPDLPVNCKNVGGTGSTTGARGGVTNLEIGRVVREDGRRRVQHEVLVRDRKEISTLRREHAQQLQQIGEGSGSRRKQETNRRITICYAGGTGGGGRMVTTLRCRWNILRIYSDTRE